MSQRIYCISGLGANEQVFSKLQLENIELVFLNWLVPMVNEPIESYAKRMFQDVKEEHPLLMGVSFGGMICIEIAKLFEIKKLILISSVKQKTEIPFWFRTAATLQLHRFIRPETAKILSPFENYFLGVQGIDEKKMTNTFRKQVDKNYLRWAIHQIVHWSNVTIPSNCLHIHGTGDRIFPSRYVKADYLIQNGGHFMVYNKASEISPIINRELSSIYSPVK